MVPLAVATALRPEIHAGYACNLIDQNNSTSWLDYGWDYLDVINFAGAQHGVAVQRDGAAPWAHSDHCNPTANPTEAAFIAHAHSAGVRVLLGVVFNNSLGSGALFGFLNDPAAMELSASSMCARAQEAHCDGLSVDFEVGNTRHNETFKGLYAGYINRISSAASKLKLSVVPTLFMDIPSCEGVDAKAVVAAASGGTVLMTYDYHWGCSDKVAGPVAPLFGNNGHNVNATVAWSLANSMPPADLLLGVAWYGREYPTTSDEYQAPTNCSETEADQDVKAYQAPLALKRARKFGRGGELWDATTQTPWYKFQDRTRPWLWWEGYFDDSRSLALKYELVKERGLKGVLIWMLNGCTQTEAPEVWRGLAAAFGKRTVGGAMTRAVVVV